MNTIPIPVKRAGDFFLVIFVFFGVFTSMFRGKISPQNFAELRNDKVFLAPPFFLSFRSSAKFYEGIFYIR